MTKKEIKTVCENFIKNSRVVDIEIHKELDDYLATAIVIDDIHFVFKVLFRDDNKFSSGLITARGERNVWFDVDTWNK